MAGTFVLAGHACARNADTEPTLCRVDRPQSALAVRSVRDQVSYLCSILASVVIAAAACGPTAIPPAPSIAETSTVSGSGATRPNAPTITQPCLASSPRDKY